MAYSSSPGPVYIIHSQWSLPALDRFLSRYGTVGFLRIMYDHNRKETNRSLTILPPESYEALLKAGYGKGHRHSKREFNIAPYHLAPVAHPIRSLFIPIPSEFLSDESMVTDAVSDKMSHLEEWGILPPRTWKIHVPLKSRELGIAKGTCFISFPEAPEGEVAATIQEIAMVRVLLSDTYWPSLTEGDTNRSFFQCFWSRHDGKRSDGRGGDKRGVRKERIPHESGKGHKKSNDTPPPESGPKLSSVSLPTSWDQPTLLPPTSV